MAEEVPREFDIARFLDGIRVTDGEDGDWWGSTVEKFERAVGGEPSADLTTIHQIGPSRPLDGTERLFAGTLLDAIDEYCATFHYPSKIHGINGARAALVHRERLHGWVKGAPAQIPFDVIVGTFPRITRARVLALFNRIREIAETGKPVSLASLVQSA